MEDFDEVVILSDDEAVESAPAPTITAEAIISALEASFGNKIIIGETVDNNDPTDISLLHFRDNNVFNNIFVHIP